ncbi:MAG TPA: SIMPL domain-containing protein [Flavisolibacter sp.]|nr:SIMPL domain-containing protein [Flavisolibacter sp.]
MNKIFIPILLILVSVSSYAQSEKPAFPKTITVNGSAELEIVPDEIYVNIDLKEYEKKGQPKVGIDKIKADFLKNAKSVGIPDSAITIASYDGSHGNPWLRKKKKNEELLASITYQVKLKSSRQMDELVNVLDDQATNNFAIVRTSHSRIAEIRKQLKIEAVKAAREKAAYLSAAIDEKLGEAVTINEPVEHYMPYYNKSAYSNMMVRQNNEAADVMEGPETDFTKIKFKYDVTVVFALK